MSGYLQRLAEGAARPSANIRPLLDPLFSGLKPREGASFPDEEHITEPAGTAPLARAGPTTPADFSRPADPAGRRAAPLLSPVVEAESDAGGHPVGEAGRSRGRPQPEEAPPAASRGPGPARSVSPRFLVASQETGGRSGHPSPGDSDAGDSDAGFESPRRETPAAREAGVQPGRPVSPLVSLIREQSAAPPIARDHPAAQIPRKVSGAVPREPDEINIHIGRIEVTAVQPQAPGAAAPRARRPGTSLDEYLRQRDRRSP
jgi:hypothetical protein